MNFKLFLGFLAFTTISVVADSAEESAHTLFEFFSKNVLFREECAMNPTNPHCQVVERCLALNHANGMVSRYLEQHENELFEEYQKAINHSQETIPLFALAIKRKKENALFNMLMNKHFIVKELENAELHHDFENSARELITQSHDFKDKPKYLQEKIFEQQSKVILEGMVNAYNNEIQE